MQRFNYKVFLRDMSALVPPQPSPLPLDEIRDQDLAFFRCAKPRRAGAGSHSGRVATKRMKCTTGIVLFEQTGSGGGGDLGSSSESGRIGKHVMEGGCGLVYFTSCQRHRTI